MSAADNSLTGIVAGDRATLIGNVTTNNMIRGIWAGAGSLVRANIANSNSEGIRVGEGSTVSGNTTNDNFRVAEGVVGAGILAGDGSTVTGNTARGNRAPGLVLVSGYTGYAHNVLTGNDWASSTPVQAAGGLLQIGPNVCGTALCP